MSKCFRLIHSADIYGSFFPTVTEAHIKDGINTILAVCCVTDNSTLTGEFRVALKSNTDLKIPLDLESVMGQNPFQDLKFSFPTSASDLKFMNNRWHTEWYSLQDEIEAGHVAIEKLNADNETYATLVNRVKRVLFTTDRARDCCFRLEVGCPANSDELDLNIRWLPASATFLKNHSRLNSGDVATINGGSIQIFTSIFHKSMRDRMSHFPLAPTIFVDHEMGTEDYAACVLEYFPSILAGIRGFNDLSFQDAKKYVKSPSPQSGNIQRFKCKRKVPFDHNYSAVQHASGTYTLSKFGTKKKIWNYIAEVPSSQMKKICLSKANSTWDSYLTAWRTFNNFCILKRRKPYIPVESNVLLDYVCYLDESKGLQYSTIQSYLSALKKLHHLNMVSDKAFDCTRLDDVMQGIKNESILRNLVSDKQYRCVMTWTVLRILGICIWKCDFLEDFNKQVIWTLCLFCFFGAFRGGEMLSKNGGCVDPFRVITWSKIKRLSNDQLLVDLVMPKTSEAPEGVVVDIFRYPGEVAMCPVENLDYLIEMVKSRKILELEDAVFLLSDGKMLTTTYMNHLLKVFLKPFFPDVLFSTHSFRAGLPSHMATKPEVFSLQDAMLGGRWKSDTVKRYQRLHGVAQKQIISKFHKVLQVHIFLDLTGIYEFLY